MSRVLFKRQVSLGKDYRGKRNERKKTGSCKGAGEVLGCQGWLWGDGAETVGFIPADRIP